MPLKISVIMSVYNTKEKYLRAAIESILNQTLSDFEFLIFDDASDESTKRVLASYHDRRIKLYHNEKNMGLTYNLNQGLRMAKGIYVARMDADDISDVNRFQKMAKVLDNHRSIQVMGSYIYNEKGINKGHGNIPYKIRKALFLMENAGIAHPTLFVRRDFLVKNGISYNEKILRSQDYEFWTQCIRYTNIYVFPQKLLFYRCHDQQISNQHQDQQKYYLDIIRKKLLGEFGNELTEKDKEDFIHSRTVCCLTKGRYSQLEKNIYELNTKYELYDHDALRYVLKINRLKYIKNNQKSAGKKYLTIFKEILDYNLWKHLVISSLCKSTIISWWILRKC